MKITLSFALLLMVMLSVAARAEVKSGAPDGFLVEHRYELPTTPQQAWNVLIHPERYWPSDHTWSGSAGNLSLRVEAGGCFCEAWDSSSVEHGRVVMAVPGKLLRIRAPLGPLQELALTGVLNISLKTISNGTEAVVTYRVSGDSMHELTDFAPVVDEVIGLQLGGFAKLASQPAAE